MLCNAFPYCGLDRWLASNEENRAKVKECHSEVSIYGMVTCLALALPARHSCGAWVPHCELPHEIPMRQGTEGGLCPKVKNWDSQSTHRTESCQQHGSEAAGRSFPNKSWDDSVLASTCLWPWQRSQARRFSKDTWIPNPQKCKKWCYCKPLCLGGNLHSNRSPVHSPFMQNTYFNFWNSSTRLDFCPGDILAKMVPFTRI